MPVAAPVFPIPSGIVAFVSTGRKPFDQRERIEAALAQLGLLAFEIVEENASVAAARGRYGIARVRELAASSKVDALVVASCDVLATDPKSLEGFRRDMAAHGVRVMALE